MTARDLDKILRHARAHGEALLYTPPAEGKPVEFELVAYRPPRRALEPTEPLTSTPHAAPHAPK